jgi:cytochrome oxidase Cu insertion factor (SCO1/SenC/PrrC family)
VSPRLKLLLIAVACAAPMVLATLTYYFDWAPGNAGNYGELIPPKPLSAKLLEPLRGKWVLVMFDTAACDAYCQRKLYFMRQTRKAQGKHQHRLERLWLVTDGSKPSLGLISAIEGTHIVPAEPVLTENFPGERESHIYLIDPLGNLMLRFPREPDPKLIIKDLQRLLKYSGVG